MTRKKWADLRSASAETPERLAARELARQKLDKELADYAAQHPELPPSPEQYAEGVFQFMDKPWPRPSGDGRPTVNISVAMEWNEAVQESLGVDKCSQCGNTLELGSKVLLWPLGGDAPFGLLACSPLCWKKVRDKVGGNP